MDIYTTSNDRGTIAEVTALKDGRFLTTVSVISRGYGTRRTQSQTFHATAAEAQAAADEALLIH